MKKLSFALAAVTLLTTVSAHAGGERFLGTTVLDRRTDGDLIRVGRCPSLGNPAVRSLQVRVSRNDAEIDYLSVKYGNGQVDRLYVRQQFNQGSRSRWIDLSWGLRCVESVYVIGQTQGRGPKAAVSVYGAR